MDKFSHDLTLALEETSLLDRARVRWGRRRRTRSTGNLRKFILRKKRIRLCGPRVGFCQILIARGFICFAILAACAPQPTEDSSSSPTDAAASNVGVNAIVSRNDGLDTNNVIHLSDSDEKEELELRLPCKPLVRVGTLESDSLNETFSPAR